MTTLLAMALAGGFAQQAAAQRAGNAAQAAEEEKPDAMEGTARDAGKIVSQPARDLGIAKTKVPPLLEEASKAPYSVVDVKTCRQISNAIIALNIDLGPDYEVVTDPKKENQPGRFAKAGGRALVNSLIPFRALVREATGAGPAQRRLDEAIEAGMARRGFLRGMHYARGCKTPVK